MIKTLSLLLALSLTAVVAGCGGSSSSSSTTGAGASTPSSTSVASASSSTTSSASATSRFGRTKPGAGSNSTRLANTRPRRPLSGSAVRACKSAVNAQRTIPPAYRAKLSHICDVAGTGDKTKLHRLEHDVCVAIIKQRIPASAQQAAEQSCPKA